MPTFIKKPMPFVAHQWFPGNGCPGVMNDHPADKSLPFKLCGCVMVGGPEGAHVHTAHAGQVVVLEPGDWVTAEPNGNGYYPIKPDIMEKMFDLLSTAEEGTKC